MIDMVLDLDTGIDDSIALVLASIDKNVNLLGVLGTYGNVTTDVGACNALKILQLAGRADVPVYQGRFHSLKTNNFHPSSISQKIHGANGTANIELPQAKRKVEEEDGIKWLCRTMKEYGSNLVYVTTGPLTNLASALMEDDSIKDFKGRIVSMGGALTVRGNVSHYAEANISQDPEAAKLCYESGLDITLVGLDVTERSRLTSEDAMQWKESGRMLGSFLGDMLLYYIANTGVSADNTYVHDPSAVICALHPEYFTILPLPLTVETNGEDRGRTVVSTSRILERNSRSKACLDCDSSRIEAYLNNIRLFLCS